MVRISERKKAAGLLRDFLDSKITNDEYDNEFPAPNGDGGLAVIYDRVWYFYSGLETHFIDRTSLSAEDIEMFERCILFLHTDLEYMGSPIRIRPRLIEDFKYLLRRSENRMSIFSEQNQETSSFFSSWWPFASAGEYEEALGRHSRSE